MRTNRWTEVTLDIGDKMRVRGPGVVFELTADDRGEGHDPRCRTYADIRADGFAHGSQGLSVEPFGEHQCEPVEGAPTRFNGVTVIAVSN